MAIPDYFFVQESTLNLAFCVGILLVALSLLTLFVTLGIRVSLVFSEHQKIKCHKVWKPIIAESLVDLPSVLPKLQRNHIKHFVMLWNYFFLPSRVMIAKN